MCFELSGCGGGDRNRHKIYTHFSLFINIDRQPQQVNCSDDLFIENASNHTLIFRFMDFFV